MTDGDEEFSKILTDFKAGFERHAKAAAGTEAAAAQKPVASPVVAQSQSPIIATPLTALANKVESIARQSETTERRTDSNAILEPLTDFRTGLENYAKAALGFEEVVVQKPAVSPEVSVPKPPAPAAPLKSLEGQGKRVWKSHPKSRMR